MNVFQIEFNDFQYSDQLTECTQSDVMDHLVYLSTEIRKKIAYSINIDGGRLIIGVDNLKALINIEINIPRMSWIQTKKLMENYCQIQNKNSIPQFKV